MDDPSLEPLPHAQALRGLERINFLSGSVRILWRPVRSLALETSSPLRILDIASGAGDVPAGLWRAAQRSGFKIDVDGSDVSSTAIGFARKRAEASGASVRFFPLNPLEQPLPSGYDVITCSLFLHHLSEPDTALLLRRMLSAAGRLVLVNDLLRHPAGLAMALSVPQLLSRSPVVHADAPLSVRAAYTREEILSLCRSHGLPAPEFRRRWPYRYLLQWKK
jgi:ubiquinone/menaquinone biosynthesis C-methylase UbiE